MPTAGREGLTALGIGRVFGPGDDPQAIVDYIRDWHGARRGWLTRDLVLALDEFAGSGATPPAAPSR